MMRKAIWRFLTVAETGLEATKVAGVSVAGMTVRERLFRAVRAFLTPPDRVTVLGDNCLYLPKRAAWEPSYLNGVYERGTTSLFQRIVKPGMMVVDVGAHIGYFTLLAARLVGETGKVYAFEPEPENFALLAKNVEVNRYRNVVCRQQAVCQETGSAELFLGKYSITHSLSRPAGSDGAGSISAETTSLDDFFAREGWPSIHLVKMDIEGWEWSALAGMTELLRRCRHLKLVLEFTPSLLLGAGVEPTTFLQRLQDLGFSIRAVDDVEGLQPLEMSSLHRRRGSNLLCERA
jgi:FkbM family methyltransferase